MPLLVRDDQTTPVDLSVVILNWNAEDYLRACLRSIVAQTHRHTMQIIVVDNLSLLDNSAQMVREEFGQFELLALDRNTGFAGGNNLGLARARGRYVLFLNPDTIVHENAFDALIEWMDAHPEVGACGPQIVNPDGTLQASCRAFPSLGAGFFRNTPLGRLWPNNPWTRGYLMEGFDHNRASAVDWLSGCALLIRRAAIKEIAIAGKLWDEDFFMYCEDVDVCYRLKAHGWPRFYAPIATITHRIGASSDWAQGAMIRRFHASMLRFAFKHYLRGPKIVFAPIVVAGVGARALGAVLKLYRGYFKLGEFGTMVRRKLKMDKKN